LGPALLLDLFLAGSVVATATGRLARPATTPTGRALRALLAAGALAPAAYVLAIRPWLQHWGATAAEQHQPLPATIWCPSRRPRPRGPLPSTRQWTRYGRGPAAAT